MSFRTSGNFTVATILMLLAGAQSQESVTLSSQSLCALTGSEVQIPCKYTSSSSSVRAREWYQVQRSDGEPQDLSKDPQYLGRVSISTLWNDCTLIMYNVKVSDSGVYNFRFRTWSSEWISASSGLTLTVTDLQVKVDPETVGQREVKLTCSSTCSFSKTPQYYWYRNGQYRSYRNDASIMLHSTSVSDEGSYSCSVYGSRQHSPAVCVLGKQCWGVTYTPKHVCALKGSSVDLFCSYKYPGGHTVTESFWFITEQQVGIEPVDVRVEEEYEGRVQYRQSSQNDCSMTITHLRESDAHTYRFRFHTDSTAGKYTGRPGVSLSVTDLKITVSDRSSRKHLICSSTCTLPNNPTYIWYRNGQPVYNQNTNGLYVYDSSEDAGSYSCAVRGYEELRSPAVYPPRVPSVTDRVSGDSVILLCYSDSNPIRTSGRFYCVVQNQFGSSNSSEWSFTSGNPAGTYAASGVTVGLFLTLIAVCLWMRGRTTAVSSRSEETSAKHDSTPVDDNFSALDMPSDPTNHDVHYSNINFTRCHTQEVSLYSTVQLTMALSQEEEVEYARVNFSACKDETHIYSTISRT
ncbi:uncharacterized protein LOC118240407 [Electrophorus electricus]|uniref:uncharacterized protein LOC118240407 n=1 Tax=Electrophorus electricus TaxID=8005 RepID=UPI0015D0C3A7|nr:uncharacterized protein LOC118240407 [Electrophorus electricus]